MVGSPPRRADTLDVRTRDGVMDVHLLSPKGPGPFPTVLFYVDAGGPRPVMFEMAERLVAEGYFVAMPNIFYRAGTLYFGVADNDSSCTPESQAKLKTALDEQKLRYQLEVFPGAAHGFAVKDMPEFNEAAAERHWTRLLALFADALR